MQVLEEGFAAAEVVLDYLLARAKPPEQIEAYTRKTILCTACHTDAEAIEGTERIASGWA